MATLESKALGSIVKIKESGSLQEFYIAAHGYPASGRTLLVRRYIYDIQQWEVTRGENGNAYASSSIDSWLTGTYYNSIAADIRSQISAVTIEYSRGNGSTVKTTMPRKVFLLSKLELYRGTSTADNNEGKALSVAVSDLLKIAYDSTGVAQAQWTRSPYIKNAYQVSCINAEGTPDYVSYGEWHGTRPAFTLPSSFIVDNNGNVIPNTAPSVPGAITLPGTINGGVQFTLSWGASTDEQNNLGGYILERQLNGGSWTRIFQANLTTTTDTVPFGTATVAYRVKAYDAEGLESAYQTSQTKTVVNNTAPTTPGSITLPTTVIGGKSIVVAWGGSADAEGNLKQYELYRSIDGGSSWTLIYSGTALSHIDMITKGWPSVKYQVRAVDTQGAASGYTVSETRTVDNTVPPEISSGNSSVDDNGIAWPYTVTQADNEQTTVTEAIDGKTHRTYTAALGQQNTFSISGMDFMKLLNGSHTLSVTATSAGGKSVSSSVTVTKAVYEATMTLTNPLPADALITRMVMSVTGHIPPDAFFEVMVTNNANDPSPAWENATAAVKGAKKFFFTNTNAANGSAFNFRLTARRGSTGGYISLIGGAFE